MRKLLGYIPLDPGEQHSVVAKETDVIKIEGQWFKLSEVWVPGVNDAKFDLASKMTFSPSLKIEFCVNCGMRREQHKGPKLLCPAKDEKDLPGRKYD